MADSILLANNRIESILSMSEDKPIEETVDNNFLLNPDQLAGVSEENPIQRNAEAEVLQPQVSIESFAPNKIESILNFDPDLKPVAPELDVDKQDPSFLDELGYFFSSSENDVTNAAIWAEAKWPMGLFVIDSDGFKYLSPEEAYGEGFNQADEVTRGEMIKAAKLRRLAEDYPEFSYQEPDSPVAEFLGTAGKILASPTTLFPIGKSYKAMAGIGALLGAEYEILDQMAEEREIYDPQAILESSAIGSVASVGIGAAINKITKSSKRSYAERQNRKRVEEANADAKVIYDEIVKIQATEDIAPQKLPEVVGQRIGMRTEDVVETLKVSGRKIVVPTRPQAKAILEATSSDALGSGILSNNLGILSSEIARYSKTLSQKLVRSEGRKRRRAFAMANKVKPHLDAINKNLPKTLRGSFNDNLLEGNIDAAKKILTENTSLGADTVDNIRKVLDLIYTDLQQAGIQVNYRKGFIPRYLLDRNGLRAYYGSKSVEVAAIDKELESLAKKLGKKVSDLTSEEESVVYNSVIQRRDKAISSGREGFTKARTINVINEGNRKFYDDFESGIYKYINDAYHTIETKNFFGAQAKTKADNLFLDIEDSLGELLAREEISGAINKQDIPEIKRLVKLAVESPKTPSGLADLVQSIGYSQTITNYLSTMMQLGDVPHHIRRNGLFPTAEALLNPLGRKDIKVENILGDVIAAEMGTTKSIAKGYRKFTERLLNSYLTGFTRLDKFMKGSYLKGALRKASKQVQTREGLNKLREDYSGVFKDDFADLVDDLRNERLTDNVKDYLFLDASDLYPTSHLEQISAVVNQPNWRVLTMLKSYTLKSIYDGLIRRDIIGNAKKGRHKEAAKNFLYLSMAMGFSEATLIEAKDFMLGRGFNAGDIPNNFGDGLLRTLGFSRYVVDRYLERGDIVGATVETVLPPLIIFEAAGLDAAKALNEELNIKNSKVIGGLPIIGRFYTNYLMLDANGETQRERQIKSQELERIDRAIEQRRKQVLGERKYSY